MQTDHRFYCKNCCYFSFCFLIPSVSLIYSHHMAYVWWRCVCALRLCCQLTYKNVYLHNSLSNIHKANLTTHNPVENNTKCVWMQCCSEIGKIAHCEFNLSGIRREKIAIGKCSSLLCVLVTMYLVAVVWINEQWSRRRWCDSNRAKAMFAFPTTVFTESWAFLLFFILLSFQM